MNSTGSEKMMVQGNSLFFLIYRKKQFKKMAVLYCVFMQYLKEYYKNSTKNRRKELEIYSCNILTLHVKWYFGQKRRGAYIKIVISYTIVATYSTGFRLALNRD